MNFDQAKKGLEDVLKGFAPAVANFIVAVVQTEMALQATSRPDPHPTNGVNSAAIPLSALTPQGLPVQPIVASVPPMPSNVVPFQPRTPAVHTGTSLQQHYENMIGAQVPPPPVGAQVPPPPVGAQVPPPSVGAQVPPPPVGAQVPPAPQALDPAEAASFAGMLSKTEPTLMDVRLAIRMHSMKSKDTTSASKILQAIAGTPVSGQVPLTHYVAVVRGLLS